MYNDLFSIGPITVHGYGTMIAIGVVLAIMIAEQRAKKRKMDSDVIFSLGLFCVVTGFLSAKLLFILVEWKNFIANPLSFLSNSGFVVYGGIIGGVLFAILFCKFKKLFFWDYFDIVLPSVAVTQGFGRIGCFLAGCCYGRETDAWYGIAFSHSNYAPNGVKMIPTQLFSAAGMFIIATIVMIYARKQRRPGRPGSLYLILYSIGRFGIEFLRNDYRGEIGPLSTSQFISLFIVVIGIGLFVTRKERSEYHKEEQIVEV